MARNKYGKSFDEAKARKKERVQARRKAAQAKNAKRERKGKGIESYDARAKGGRNFDMKDVKNLKKKGYSNKEIKKYARSLGEGKLSEGIKRNEKAYAGKSYIGDQKVENIKDYDSGKGFNMADVKHLKRQGFSDKEISKYANSQVKEAGKKHGNAMSKYMEQHGQLDYNHGDWKKAKEKAKAHQKSSGTNTEDNTGTKGGNGGNQDTATPPNSGDNNVVDNNTKITNKQTQKVNQDNDINTSINGDNNQVYNNQDNSIRQYGGDNRSLVINEGSGKKGSDYYTSADKAITMGTLGGFYSPDDSPAGQAKFVDMNQRFNFDAQKKYENFGKQTANKYSGFRGGDTNLVNLQKRIDGNEQFFRDRATIQEVKTYGDRAAKTSYPVFEFGDPLEEIESNVGEIAKGYKDDIEDV